MYLELFLLFTGPSVEVPLDVLAHSNRCTFDLLELEPANSAMRLKNLLAHACADAWDGAAAAAISDDVFDLAARIAAHYGPVRLHPDVAAGEDGSVAFVWEAGGNYVYLEVGPSNAVHLFVDYQGTGKWEGVGRADEQRIVDRLRTIRTTLEPSATIELPSAGATSSPTITA